MTECASNVPRTPLVEAFFRAGKADECPVYDLHGHMGPFSSIYFPFETPEAMITRMDRAGVRALVFSHHGALLSPELGNRPTVEAVSRFPDRLRGYCVANPNYPDRLRAELDAYSQNEDVFVGFKLHGSMHTVALTDPRYQPVFEYADHRELPVLMHTWGGSRFDGEEQVASVAERYRRITFLLGHSLHNDWDAAIRLARRFDNVVLELCAVLDERTGVLERFVQEADPGRIVFGTDLPWFSYHYYIGSVLGSDISDEHREAIFFRNALRIMPSLPRTGDSD